MRGWRGGSGVAALVLALLGAACGTGTPALQAPDPAGFDPRAMIDVLPPDSIEAIRRPEAGSVEDARRWLGDADPVIALEAGGHARAYPVAILMLHEIVNDAVGGHRVAVSYCPLCNTAIVYDREVQSGLVVTFIVSGKLYLSDLVMLDEQTTSLWPQMLGEAVAGELKGTRLKVIPSAMVSFEEFAATHPDGTVLRRPVEGIYGENPYPRYDSRARPYGDFFAADPDARLPAMQRVVGVARGRVARAYPFDALAAAGRPSVVHDRLGGSSVVIFHGGSQRSALDAARIAAGRLVGSSGVFEPRARGRDLTFAVSDGAIVDEQTGSTWSILGLAAAGPLAGEQLRAIPHVDAFWFAWAAFHPETGIWRATGVAGSG